MLYSAALRPARSLGGASRLQVHHVPHAAWRGSRRSRSRCSSDPRSSGGSPRCQIGQSIRDDGPAGAHQEGGHAHDGRHADPLHVSPLTTLLLADLDEPVRLDRARRHAGARAHRLLRRLGQGDASATRVACPDGSAWRASSRSARWRRTIIYLWSDHGGHDHHAVPEERPPRPGAVVHPVRRRRDCGRGERREPDRRPRRPRHRPGDDRRRHLRRVRLRRGQRHLRRVPAGAARPWRGRARGLLRRAGRRRAWASSGSTPIRRRCSWATSASLALGAALGIAGADHPAGARAARRRRRVRGRDAVGDRPGRVLQAAAQAHLPHGADPPSLRAARLARAADHRAVLDRRRSSAPCVALATLKLR